MSWHCYLMAKTFLAPHEFAKSARTTLAYRLRLGGVVDPALISYLRPMTGVALAGLLSYQA